jgi:SAM-dependent methyltransferase
LTCCSPDDQRYDRHFDARHAAQQLREYRRSGPPRMTQALIDGLAAGGVEQQTVLDIGGGVGAVHHELLRSGAASAIDVDASGAYIDAAREEAARQGHADRAQYVTGDFVAVAPDIAPADLVALDRVICCYPDMASLVGRSASLARRRYGLVYPRDTWLGRIGITILNASSRLTRSPFRAYVHRTAEVEAILAREGLVKRLHRTSLFWQLSLFERPVD